MRQIAISVALAVLFVPVACGGGGGRSVDDTRVPEGPARCDMKMIVKADWCATCRTFCGVDCPMDASGNCKACGKPTQKMDACVRTFYTCTECKTKHDKACQLNDSYQCCTKTESKSRLVCACGASECPGASCAKCKEKGGCKKRCLHQ